MKIANQTAHRDKKNKTHKQEVGVERVLLLWSSSPLELHIHIENSRTKKPIITITISDFFFQFGICISLCL